MSYIAHELTELGSFFHEHDLYILSSIINEYELTHELVHFYTYNYIYIYLNNFYFYVKER